MSSFITNFKSGFNGGTRSNRFLVKGPIPYSEPHRNTFTNFHIRSTIMPDVNTTTLTYDYFGRKFHYPGEKQYSSWAFVVLDDTGSNNLWGSFARWQNKINEHTTNQTAVPITNAQTDYKAYNWEIVHLDLNGNTTTPNKTFVLHGCWPVQVGQLNLNMAKPNNMNTFQVTVMFDYLEIKGKANSLITRR